MVVFGQRGIVWARRLYSVKVVVFVQKLLYSDKSGCNRVIVVVFRKKSLFSGKVVVFGKKRLY